MDIDLLYFKFLTFIAINHICLDEKFMQINVNGSAKNLVH